MFEDKARQTQYGRLVEGIDTLLITPEGEKILESFDEELKFYEWVKSLPDKLPEEKHIARFSPEEHGIKGIPDLRLKVASRPYLTQKTRYGLLIEIPTLAEIQKYMAEKGNQGKQYEFVPQGLYFGAGDFILTEWVIGSDWNNVNQSTLPKLNEAMQELRRDLMKTGLYLEMSGVNFIYIGRNRKTRKPKFAVIDQLDESLADKLR